MRLDIVREVRSSLDDMPREQWRPFCVSSDQLLIRQGAPSNSVFILSEGSVKLVRVEYDNPEVVVDVEFACCLVGSSEVLAHSEYITSAYTLEYARGLEIRAPLFRELLKHNKLLFEAVQARQLRNLHRRTVRLVEVASLSAYMRVSRVLNDLALRSSRGPTEIEAIGRIAMKKLDLAAAASITPSHLSRILDILEKDGKICRRKGWILVKSDALV